MKANALVIAALAISAATPAIAQRSDQTPQRTNLPTGGLTLDFNEIDRNQDRVISVEEWNAFIAKLRERTAERGTGGGGTGNAASGAGNAASGSSAKDSSSRSTSR
jgi:hypothetical protein